MKSLRTQFLLIILFLLPLTTNILAQENGYLDSLNHSLKLAKTDAERTKLLEDLSVFYMVIDRSQADVYIRQLQDIAERSRDRRLMVRALLTDASRYYVVGAGNREDGAKALISAQRALDLAKASGLDDGEAGAYMMLAHIARGNGESDKALNYDNLALSLAGNTDSDSLRVSCLASVGDTYMLKEERLLAFRHYLQALSLAEGLQHYEPLKEAYYKLAEFYQELGEYEKAKDYLFKIYALTIKYNDAFERIMLYRYIGVIYTQQKQYDVATSYYEKVLAVSDSLRFETFRVTGYVSILEQYLQSGQADKALAYFKASPDLRDFMRQAHAERYIYQTYGLVHSGMGRYDSAQYYYDLAEPLVEGQGNVASRYKFYTYQAKAYSGQKQYDKALVYLQKANRLGEVSGNLEMKQAVSLALDTTYQKLGDFKNAYFYNRQYHAYTDSLRAFATEKDLMLLEVADEAKRREREALKAEEELHARHNIQYMGITVAIAVVFIVLVMLGIFRVSKSMIKILGFFAFIFLFEFIILLADNQIHHWTHGEPWKVMVIKIILISLLLPLHHFLEEKVIHYLTSHHLLERKNSLLSRLRGAE